MHHVALSEFSIQYIVDTSFKCLNKVRIQGKKTRKTCRRNCDEEKFFLRQRIKKDRKENYTPIPYDKLSSEKFDDEVAKFRGHDQN